MYKEIIDTKRLKDLGIFFDGQCKSLHTIRLEVVLRFADRSEDLKVLGSIPSVGTVQALVAQFGRAWV